MSIKKESDLPVMYLCIFEKLKKSSIESVIDNNSMRRILGMVFKLKLSEQQLILKEMEMMGLIKRKDQRLFELNQDIKPIEDIRSSLYKKRGLGKSLIFDF
jgi:hypothetical protein